MKGELELDIFSAIGDCCVTIKSRSPLAPLKKGGTGSALKVPLLKGDLGGSRFRVKATFISVGLTRGGPETGFFTKIFGCDRQIR
jgi:hypothetical protein